MKILNTPRRTRDRGRHRSVNSTTRMLLRYIRPSMLCLFMLVAVVSVSCGAAHQSTMVSSSPTTGSNDVTSTAVEPTPDATQQDLVDRSLLELKDLPIGWMLAPGAINALDLVTNVCNQNVEDSGALATAHVALSHQDEALVERVGVYAADRASMIIDNTRRSFCNTWSRQRGSEQVRFEARTLAFPPIADEALAFSITASTATGEARGNQVLVLIRRDRALIELSYLTTRAPDDMLVEMLANEASAKLGEAGASNAS